MTTKRANGGHARAERLSPERRSEIASQAAKARWGEPPVIDWNKIDWRALAHGDLTLAEVSRRFGISRATLSRQYAKWRQYPDGTARGKVVEHAIANATKDGQVEIVYSVRGSDAYHDLSLTQSLAQWLHDALGDALADLKRAKARKDE